MVKKIENQADIELLVRTFYSKALENDSLAPHFEGIDFEHHFPRMFDFWGFILLGKEGFTGNVFDKHKQLNVGQNEFDVWVQLFHQTVDELFEGENAEKAKSQASLLGYTFSQKMMHLSLGQWANPKA
jgi:hemoglobin